MKKIILSTLIAVSLLFLGCSKKANYDADHRYFFSGGAAPAENMSLRAEKMFDSEIQEISHEKETSPEAANLNNAERKLIKRANVRIRTENLEAADASVSNMLSKYNAYAASTNIQENSHFYSLRVPAQYYDIFLSEMDGMGRLLQRNESTEDVTLRYYDLEGRLATKKELLKTFQAYLGKAKNIEEILAVETRIAELQYDIDGTGIQLRNLANQIDYSTIELNLLGPVSSTQNQKLTFAERIKQLFGGFGSFLSGIAVAVVSLVIYGIPVLLILGLLFWLLFGKIGLLKKLWKLIKK